MYAAMSLDMHMIYVAIMIYRIFGKKSPTHFPMKWVLIMHELVKGYDFNWAKMLDNMAKKVTEYKLAKSKG